MTPRLKPAELFSAQEIASFTARSDLAGAWAIASTWAVIACSFALLAAWPNPLSFLLAVFVLGGRQLALAILAHEAAHRTLFKTRALNDTVADWFCARPVWIDVRRYREHHMRHHSHTGTERDPDTSLVAPFPTTRPSLARKLLRDLSGLSGLRRVLGQFLMDIGVLEYTVAAEVARRPRAGRRVPDYVKAGVKNLSGFVLSNLVLAGLLAATGQLWLYAAWVLAYLTTFSLYLRIRSLAEHACTERGSDMLRNTRSTRANWLARMTVAPLRVNYHIEHHLMASVPYYRLPELHRALRKRGLVVPAAGYLEVLRLVSQQS